MKNSAKFIDAEETTIEAVIDGVKYDSIPKDPANRHYSWLVNGRKADLGVSAMSPVQIQKYKPK